ncbi:MAG: outer membrane lipoprotein carrier protein LolA [Bacteroidia bacterium]|nr:outer membrane lipoprotein carrier protein LolA [Bacteroidia bacterium]
MKIRIILLFTSILWTVAAISQTETAAVKILDKFSSAALSAPSVSMKFKLATDDLAENSSDTLSGSVIISKDKYRLELPDNIVWFTGDASWSYLPAEKEVTVTKPDKKDNSFQNKPSGIFTMYKKGYKIRLIDENAASSTIDLYPEDIKSEIIRIRLTIGKTSNDLMRLEYKRNDGVILTVMVSEYNLKFKPDQETFVFKPEKYKGVEVVDMR